VSFACAVAIDLRFLKPFKSQAITRFDVQMATSTQGGIMKGLRRSIGGESFFVNDFSSTAGGVVAVAAALPGDMSLVPVAAGSTLLVQSGSWVASDLSIDVDAKWGGGKTFFSGEGLVTDFTGPGRLWLQTRSSSDLIAWIQGKLPPSRVSRTAGPTSWTGRALPCL